MSGWHAAVAAFLCLAMLACFRVLTWHGSSNRATLRITGYLTMLSGVGTFVLALDLSNVLLTVVSGVSFVGSYMVVLSEGK